MMLNIMLLKLASNALTLCIQQIKVKFKTAELAQWKFQKKSLLSAKPNVATKSFFLQRSISIYTANDWLNTQGWIKFSGPFKRPVKIGCYLEQKEKKGFWWLILERILRVSLRFLWIKYLSDTSCCFYFFIFLIITQVQWSTQSKQGPKSGKGDESVSQSSMYLVVPIWILFNF